MTNKLKYSIGIILAGVLVVGVQVFLNARPSAFVVDCGVPISEKVCFIDKLDQEECGDTESRFAHVFGELEEIYAVSPPLVQHKMCNLNRINIVKWPGDEVGRASANARLNSIRLSWIFLKDTQDEYEEFLLLDSVGYIQNDESVAVLDWRKLNVIVEYSGLRKDDLNYGLAGAVFHEIAHLIDGNDLSVEGLHCVYDMPENAQQIQKAGINLIRTRLSQDYCTHELPLGSDSSVLVTTSAAGFSTLYASCTAGEDFAETFSEYILDAQLGVRMTITKDGEPLLNRHEQLMGPSLAAKIQTVKALLDYPLDSPAAMANMGLWHLTCEGPFDLGAL